MKKFLEKNLLAIQLSIIVFFPVIIVSVALLRKAIDLSTSISIFAVLIAIAILLISINEIRNRLRPWVAIARIDEELTDDPDIFFAHFIITNTGPIPATGILYTVTWYVQENGTWNQLEIPNVSPFKSTQHTLFPNQNLRHRSEMHDVKDATNGKDTKVTFSIEYKDLWWSKLTTTNTHKYDYIHRVWTPDDPQDYT